MKQATHSSCVRARIRNVKLYSGPQSSQCVYVTFFAHAVPVCGLLPKKVQFSLFFNIVQIISIYTRLSLLISLERCCFMPIVQFNNLICWGFDIGAEVPVVCVTVRFGALVSCPGRPHNRFAVIDSSLCLCFANIYPFLMGSFLFQHQIVLFTPQIERAQKSVIGFQSPVVSMKCSYTDRDFDFFSFLDCVIRVAV